jgi:hypothetical protein
MVSHAGYDLTAGLFGATGGGLGEKDKICASREAEAIAGLIPDAPT